METEKRLIDANALLEVLDDSDRFNQYGWPCKEYNEGIATAKYHVSKAPTVEAIEIKHGKWGTFEMFPETPFLNGFPCSVCGKRVPFVLFYNFKYCPNCGADMRGDGNEKW